MASASGAVSLRLTDPIWEGLDPDAAFVAELAAFEARLFGKQDGTQPVEDE